MQLLTVFIILFISIVLFISNRIRTDLIAMLILLSLVLTGILNVPEAFAGFSNPIVLMIVGLFIIGAGIYRTGLAHLAGKLLLKWSSQSERKLFILLLMISAFVGAFISNTGTVALMIPIVVSLAVGMNKSPSKYLLPLSYIASMSGLLTLIASPTNLIVSEILHDYGLQPLHFFQITPIGIIAVFTVIVYLFMTRNLLLPKQDRWRGDKQVEPLSISRLSSEYNLKGDIYKLHIKKGTPIIGKRLMDLQLPAKYQVFVLQINRKSIEGIIPLSLTFEEMAGPNSIIKEKDILYIQGTYHDIIAFMNAFSITRQELIKEPNDLVTTHLGVAEVIITPNSSFINLTIKEIQFREKYNLNILSLKQQRKMVEKNKTDQKLRFGDTFLVQGKWEDIQRLTKETNDVVVIGHPEEHASVASASGKAPIAGFILLGIILLMVFETFPLVISVLIGALLMIITGCVRNMDDAYSQVNWETIVLIAAMLPMATALEKTGGMELVSQVIVNTVGPFGTIAVLSIVYIIVTTFGQFISNTATAVLFGPIAYHIAVTMEANPYTFLIAVTVASSMAFLTPVASPTNALVMTAGRYTFTDFLKIGIPLQFIMFFVMMITIQLFFPL